MNHHNPRAGATLNNLYKIILLLASLTLLACTGSHQQARHSSFIELNSGWQFRPGDSPIDKNGNLLWLSDSLNAPGWTTITEYKDFIHTGAKSSWLRIKLPDWDGKNPGIYIKGITMECQVYLDQELVYQYGNFISLDDNHFHGWRQHPIQLPDDISGRILTIRVWSEGTFSGIAPPFFLGPLLEIINMLFIQSIDELLFSALFLILGLTLLVMFFFSHWNRLYLGIAVFLLSMGLFTISNSLYLQYMINAPHLFFILDLFSLLAAPIGGFMIIEQIVLPPYRPLNKRLWQIMLVYWFAILIYVHLPGFFNLDLIYLLFFSITAIATITSFYLIFKSLKKGGVQVRILLYGFIISMSACGIEILSYYSKRIVGLLPYSVSWIHIGVLFFVASMVWIVVQRYVETHRQKEDALKNVMESAIQSERLKSEMALKHVETEKWQELDKMKSRFFANVSHEFRTPLTLILGTARQLSSQHKDKQDTSRFDMLIRNGERLLHLVNQLLDISRLESGKMTLNMQYADIIAFTRRICHTFTGIFEEKNLDFDFQADAVELLVPFDPDKLEKIVANLVSNAAKFTPPGGKINVELLTLNGTEIRVKDTGPGIGPDHLPHIFDRFYQAGNSYVKERTGSGIGLALARELVKLHRGELLVDSHVGAGTMFTVKLPNISEQVPATESSKDINLESKTFATLSSALYAPHGETSIAGTPDAPKDMNAPILLIVEDNVDMSTYIQGELCNDYQIITAFDGAAGFELATEKVPDLIVSDVMMPVMDGFTLCNQLKTDERTSHIPVILLTARSSGKSKIEGLEQGADDYLVKPFDSVELLTRCRNLIEQRRRLRERFSQSILGPLSEISVTPADEKFLNRVVQIILEHIQEQNLNIEWFSRQVGLSRSQLHRKLHALTGQSISVFIRSIRLKKAIQLLESHAGTVSEIAFDTGFGSVDYFRRCFKEQFGVAPSDYTPKA